MSLLITVLMWFHIFSAVGWLGSVLVFRIVVTPIMPKFSAQTRAELVVKLFPTFVTGVVIFAASTGLFGILHLVASSIEEPPHFSLILPWIGIGASIAVVVFLLALFVAYPSIKAMSRIILNMQAKKEQQPPPEFAKYQKRVAMVANVALILLLATLVFMVWAGEL
jgi:uncharacterized membrane protein